LIKDEKVPSFLYVSRTTVSRSPELYPLKKGLTSVLVTLKVCQHCFDLQEEKATKRISI
jgi:hypothetical protein